MRRADRLFQIVQLLRSRRLLTAAQMASRLEVSERTIYRDIRDLMDSGVPIEGEAGVGYRLPRSFDLPPLMFTAEEIAAMVLGARLVRRWADLGLQEAAGSALAKIEAVLPERLRSRVDALPIFAPNFNAEPDTTEHLGRLRQAIHHRQKVHLAYTRTDGTDSKRTIRPLCLAFFAPVWLVSAWCELRQEFRNFRVDRIRRLSLLDEQFTEEVGKSLDDFLRQVTAGSG